MNKQFYYFSTILLGLTMMLSGCIKDHCTQMATYVRYDPVYMTFEELRAAGQTEAARELKQPGKMIFKDGFIFINEVSKGIHIIDNRNPNHPQNMAFINLPGNHDLAAKGQVLYADSYTDLVAIDISNPLNTSTIRRVEDVFPYGMWHDGLAADPEYGVVIEWIRKEVTEEVPCSDIGSNNLPLNWFRVQEDVAFTLDTRTSNNLTFTSGLESASTLSNTTSLGGSLARFTILDNHLYTVTIQSINPFDISNLENPTQGTEVWLGWGIETIFPYDGHLLIGSQTGMFVLSVDNPDEPQVIGSFEHIRSCDPVVAENDIAYVTLRGGGVCGGAANQLDVLDISRLSRPELLISYPLHGPYGLGIHNGILFICDGSSGLKVYDASDIYNISANMIASFPNIFALDVIPLSSEILLLISRDGLYQYDYTDPTNIVQISHIPVAS